MAQNPYQGNYKGTFKSNFDGEWTFTVDANGEINDLTISLAPDSKGKGKIDADGNLTAKLRVRIMTVIWTAKVTKDLKIVDGKTNRGGI